MTDWGYDAWAPVNPANWGELSHIHPWEHDCHVDIGCGTVKKGRIGIDRYPAAGVNVVMDLDTGCVGAIATAPNEDAEWPYSCPVEFGGAYGYRRSQGIGEIRTIAHGLPFEDGSIESIISHHCLEHIGEGFIPLMDDIYRVLKPGGTFCAITPLFPSTSAVADPDHCRYFMVDTWKVFEGHLGDENNPTGSWLDSFSVPYTKARFELLDIDATPRCEPAKHWTDEDAREMRVALRAVK
jgi:SAM-dependent methyltransferase